MLQSIEMMFFRMGVPPIFGYLLIAFILAFIIFIAKLSFELWLYEEETRSYEDSIGAHSKTLRKENDRMIEKLAELIAEKQSGQGADAGAQTTQAQRSGTRQFRSRWRTK